MDNVLPHRTPGTALANDLQGPVAATAAWLPALTGGS